MEEDMASVLKRRSRHTACFPWKSSQPRQQVQETSHTLRNSRQQMEKTTWNEKNLFPDVLGVSYGNKITDLTLH